MRTRSVERSVCLTACAILALSGSTVAAPFIQQRIPISTRSAQVFVADANTDSAGDFCVLDGNRLRVFSGSSGIGDFSIDLQDGTTAIDVADVSGDGTNELITVSGDAVLMYSLAPGSDRSVPHVLFSLDTRFAPPSPRPYPHVLVIEKDGAAALALPRQGAIELRSIAGELIERYDLASTSDDQVQFGSPFSVWYVDPPQTSAPGGLEFRVSSIDDRAPLLPAGLPGPLAKSVSYRLGTPLQLREASELDPSMWPWFPLRTRGDDLERTLFALAPPDFADTIVRFRRSRPSLDQNAEREIVVTPNRVYPGILIPPTATLPDFNGDSYADLALWKAPLPGVSIDSLTRAAQGGTWPFVLTIHVYDPALSLYTAKPAGFVKSELPLSWFLAPEHGVPLRSHSMADFNGDGNTDLALSTAPRSIALWLFTKGFPREPDYRAELPDRIDGIEWEGDLDGDGKRTLLVRTRSAFYALSLPN